MGNMKDAINYIKKLDSTVRKEFRFINPEKYDKLTNYHADVRAKKLKCDGISDYQMLYIDTKTQLNKKKKKISIQFSTLFDPEYEMEVKKIGYIDSLLTKDRYGDDYSRSNDEVNSNAASLWYVKKDNKEEDKEDESEED